VNDEIVTAVDLIRAYAAFGVFSLALGWLLDRARRRRRGKYVRLQDAPGGDGGTR
jgi:hypothetical protein